MKKTILAVAMLLSAAGMQAFSNAGKPVQTISLGSSAPRLIDGSAPIGISYAGTNANKPGLGIGLPKQTTPVAQ